MARAVQSAGNLLDSEESRVTHGEYAHDFEVDRPSQEEEEEEEEEEEADQKIARLGVGWMKLCSSPPSLGRLDRLRRNRNRPEYGSRAFGKSRSEGGHQHTLLLARWTVDTSVGSSIRMIVN
jgi:hypothetical protein